MQQLNNKNSEDSVYDLESNNENSMSQLISNNSNSNSKSSTINVDGEVKEINNNEEDNPPSLSETWPRPLRHKNQTSLELLAGSINPADGSFVYGLPLNVQHDLEELQKQQEQHHEREQEQKQKEQSRTPDKETSRLNSLHRRNTPQQVQEAEQDVSHNSSNHSHDHNGKAKEQHEQQQQQQQQQQANAITDAVQRLKHIFWIDRHGQHNNNAAPTAPHITTNAAPAIATAESPLLTSFARNASFASNASSNGESSDDEEDEEDRRNLHNRATLDIYLPVPMDTLFRFMDQERKSEAAAAHHVQTFSNKGKHHHHQHQQQHFAMKRKKFPIIIAINGGAWIIGCYFWNTFVSRVLAARGYVVFCPDYRNFPQTTMEGMTLDVSDAIAWVLNNAERYNGDLDDVTLLGQSAGAHLTMMSILSQAHLSAFEANTSHNTSVQTNITTNNMNNSNSNNNNSNNGKQVTGMSSASTEQQQEQQHYSEHTYLELPLTDFDGKNTIPPSSVAYNVPRYNPRQSIHNYVGLSGIYNVKGLIRHFDKRGLYRNVLYQIAGSKSEIGRFTLPNYFDDRRKHLTNETLPDNIFDFLPANMFFLHGDADKSAPVTESANLVYLMRNAQRDALIKAYQANPEKARSGPTPVTLEFILVPGATHTDAIIDEPLACGSSHVVEFLVHYRLGGSDKSWQSERRTPSTIDLPTPNSTNAFTTAGLTSNTTRTSKTNTAMTEENASNVNGNASNQATPIARNASSLPINTLSNTANHLKMEDDEENAAFPVIPLRQPDGILLTPIPHAKRT